MNLYGEWILAKNAEKNIQELRRKIEDKLTESFKVPENYEGSTTYEAEGFKIVITGRMARKVDSVAVQEIAAEIGAENLLNSIFKWKPEINAKTWKATDKSITDHFAKAITTKPGRISYKIEELEK